MKTFLDFLIRGWRLMAAIFFAMAIVGGLGFLMDRIEIDPVPEYRPQFLLVPESNKTTCGGMIVCPITSHVPGKQRGLPSRPLGLAPPRTGLDSAMPESALGRY